MLLTTNSLFAIYQSGTKPPAVLDIDTPVPTVQFETFDAQGRPVRTCPAPGRNSAIPPVTPPPKKNKRNPGIPKPKKLQKPEPRDPLE